MRGGFRLHFDAEAALQLRDGHLDVQLSLAGEQQLVRLRIARVADRRVLFLEAMHRRADLVLVAAALRLDGVGQHGFGEGQRRERDARGLVGDRVVGARVLQLGDGAEVAGLDFGHGRLRLALQHAPDGRAAPARPASRCAPSCRPSRLP